MFCKDLLKQKTKPKGFYDVGNEMMLKALPVNTEKKSIMHHQ